MARKKKADWTEERIKVEEKLRQLQNQPTLEEIKSISFNHKNTSPEKNILQLSLIIISCLVLVGIISSVGYYGLTGLATFTYITQADFNTNGTFVQTWYNSTAGGVELNITGGFKFGNFTSSVIDAGESSRWNNITWVHNTGELSSNKVNESSNNVFGSRSIDLTGNVLLMHFNNDSAYGESGTTVYDFSGNGNTGTIVNQAHPNSTSKQVGTGSYMFDGSEDYISIGSSSTLNISGSTMGFSVWVAPQFTSTYATPVVVIDKTPANTEAYRVLFAAAIDDWRFRLFTTSGAVNCETTSVSWNVDEWHHLAGSYNSTHMAIYWDGALEASCAQTGTITTNNDILAIGAEVGTVNDYLGGLDELAIWNRSLSATEITALYNRGVTRLNFSARGCDDSACSGENFTDITDTSPQNLSSMGSNRYFQYNVDFNTTNVLITPDLYNISIDYSPGAEVNAPNVTNLLPAVNTIFNTSNIIEIAANTSDQSKISSVSASVTYPNGTVEEYTLLNDTTHVNKWNSSFNSTLSGNYSLAFTATDLWTNANNSESTTFDIDYNFTFINGIAYGWANGTRSNLFYNGTSNYLKLDDLTSNGSFLSQIFDVTVNGIWNNISWISSALGELPSNQRNEISSNDYGSGNLNMTGNVLLLHFNNDSAFGETATLVYDFSGEGNNGTWIGGGSSNGNPKLGAFSGNFNGSTSVDLNPSNRLSDPNVVISLWIKPNDITNDRYVTGGASGASANKRAIIIGYQNNNFNIFNNGAYPTGTAADTQIAATQDQWQHLVYASDGSRVYGYKDGQLVIDVSANLNVEDGNMTDYNIGSTAGEGAFFNGSIDEFAIFNRTLTAEEIRLMYLRGVTRLNLSVRSCDDTACSGESFTDINDTSAQQLSDYSISNNRWFQYNVSFETINTSSTPELYNVSLNYTSASAGDSILPSVNLEAPSNNTVNTTNSTPSFFFNTTDNMDTSLECTLWLNATSGGTAARYGTNTSIANASSTDIKTNTTLSNTYYWWWVNCSDGTNSNVSVSYNISIAVDSIRPSVNLEAPSNNTVNTTNSTPSFFFNTTDNMDTSLECTLWLNATSGGTAARYGTNTSVTNASSTDIKVNTTLSNTYYWWWVNCSDGTNTNVSVSYNISIAVDNPNVTNVLPSAGSVFNLSNTIEIAANITDLQKINTALANISYPNGTLRQFTLSNGSEYASKFNVSFTTTLAGNYTVYFFANDSSNNINNTASTTFDIDYNFTFINLTAIYGYANGSRTNLFFNGTDSTNYLRLNNPSANGSFLSQIFNLQQNVTWSNISWVSRAYGELPNNEAVETGFLSSNLDMTDNLILYHFNNDSKYGENRSLVYDFSGNQWNGTWNGKGASNGSARFSGFSGEFDGDSDYLATANMNTQFVGKNLTVLAWVMTDIVAPANNRLIFGRQQSVPEKQVQGGIDTDGTIVFSTFTTCGTGTNLNSKETLKAGEWYHVAFFLNHSVEKKIYINGVENASTTSGPLVLESCGAQPTAIGANVRNPDTTSWDGLIDEVAIFTRTLSPQEINDHYQRGLIRLNLSVRSCNDAACSGESFTDINDTSPQQLASGYSITDNQYFQYNVSFETINASSTPELYNVSIIYSITTDSTKPNVTTVIPSANSIYNITNTIEIAANVTDETAVSKVFANVTYPNGTINQLTLSNKTNFDNKYNVSFTVPELVGNYNITYIGNDTTNNINSTTTSNFTANVECATTNSNRTLNKNIVASATCFTINASNINIDCAGYTILFADTDSGKAITSTGYNNITVSNCIMKHGSTSGTGDSGIDFNHGNGGNFTNNSIYANGTSSANAIYLLNATQTVINNNSLYTTGIGKGNEGIEIATNSTGVNVTNNFISTNGTSDNHGILLSGDSHHNRFINNQITANGTDNGFNNGIYLTTNASYNHFENIHILTQGQKNSSAIHLTGIAAENQFVNINLTVTDVNTEELTDGTGNGNINHLIYNNSFGEIRWTNTTSFGFLEALGTNISNSDGLGLGRNIFIGNNTIALNISALVIDGYGAIGINSSANITFYGIGLSAVKRIMKAANYTTSTADIQVHGTDCIAAGTCFNLSYSGGTLVFNTTSFSSFSANESSGANTLPTSPVPLLLANNSYTTNRTPGFRWNNSDDAEGDTLTYNLVIDDNSAFNNPEVNVTGIAQGTLNTSYDITTELNVDTAYYWKVAANDSTGYGAWSNGSNFTVQSYLLISLSTSTVAFGSVSLSEQNGTSDNAPPPFTAVNGGNILANVTITATSYFSSAAFPGSAYQFRIRANESSAFNTGLSNMSYMNMTSSYTGYHVRELDWREINDDFLVDLNITVPSGEPAGAKSSTVTFTMEGG